MSTTFAVYIPKESIRLIHDALPQFIYNEDDFVEVAYRK